MNRILKENPNYSLISYDDIKNCKNITEELVDKEFSNLKKLKWDKNNLTFCGNKIIYHYQFENILATTRDVKDYKTLKDIFEDELLKEYWIGQTIKMKRRKKLDYIEAVDIFECYRRCKGSIVCFKAFPTKYLCKRFNATKMLDFTAGWGGRLLGARSLGIKYIGIDTNTNLRSGYKKMIEKFGGMMIWESCLKVDFSQLDYDFVLTSPPYMNLEIYDHFEKFESREKYYKEFLIVMIERCLKYIKNHGKVCINISNYMYDEYLKYGGRTCIEKIDLQQQMGGKPNKEFIYVFSHLIPICWDDL